MTSSYQGSEGSRKAAVRDTWLLVRSEVQSQVPCDYEVNARWMR